MREAKEKHLGIRIDARTQEGVEQLRQAITKKLQDAITPLCIGDLVHEGDVVVLIMPQDPQAPKGRLILPQSQVIRELLDANAIPVSTTLDTMEQTFSILKDKPALIVTDSQAFKRVAACVDRSIPLTSFSLLMARQRGDMSQYIEGIGAIQTLKEGDKILIAESCTHNPLHDDIAREKIPAQLNKKCGVTLDYHWTTGHSFPEDLAAYKLIIQCGGCMHTPKQIMAILDRAREQGVAITNFGVILAYFAGILEDVWLGETQEVRERQTI